MFWKLFNPEGLVPASPIPREEGRHLPNKPLGLGRKDVEEEGSSYGFSSSLPWTLILCTHNPDFPSWLWWYFEVSPP